MNQNRKHQYFGRLPILTLVVFLISLAFSTCFLLTSCYSSPSNSVLREADLSAPEITLNGYIESLRNGNLAGVKERYFPSDIDFYLPDPIPIKSYVIIKKITFGKKEVERWNSQGTIPQAKIGDVELQVKEWIGTTGRMVSYFLRNYDGKWKIFSHSAWKVD